MSTEKLLRLCFLDIAGNRSRPGDAGSFSKLARGMRVSSWRFGDRRLSDVHLTSTIMQSATSSSSTGDAVRRDRVFLTSSSSSGEFAGICGRGQ